MIITAAFVNVKASAADTAPSYSEIWTLVFTVATSPNSEFGLSEKRLRWCGRFVNAT